MFLFLSAAILNGHRLIPTRTYAMQNLRDSYVTYRLSQSQILVRDLYRSCSDGREDQAFVVCTKQNEDDKDGFVA